jgi:flagellar biosynthesis protein FlhF
MRIKTFTAPTASAAMALVRDEMGPAAVIIAVDQALKGHGVVLRAAIEEDEEPGVQAPAQDLPVEARLEALLKARLKLPRPTPWQPA